MTLDSDSCYAALRARDRRFDGLFFVGVTTTGVYCRPICPARLPRAEHCTFFPTSAAAESAGFRACLRCRPELAPGRASVDARHDLAGRALRHIDAGMLDDGGTVAELADALNVSARHLRRTLRAELGVGPKQLAATRRAAIAKRMLQDTDLPITTVALAAGYGTVRSFNRAFRDQFGRAPSEIRRRPTRGETFSMRLDFRPPYAWDHLLSFLSARATPGVSRVTEDEYEHHVRVADDYGLVRVRRDRATSFEARISVNLAPHVAAIVRRLRRLLDLDVQPQHVMQHLGQDGALSAAILRRPGIRVPGGLDAFELAVRTVLGQQISVAAATTLIGRLAERFGERVAGRLYFPHPTTIAAATVDDVRAIGLSQRRALTLIDLAAAASALENLAEPQRALQRLASIRGIGPWTLSYLAMRVFRDPDAYPGEDLILRRRNASASTPEAWRPWRAYAAMYLWSLETT